MNYIDHCRPFWTIKTVQVGIGSSPRAAAQVTHEFMAVIEDPNLHSFVVCQMFFLYFNLGSVKICENPELLPVEPPVLGRYQTLLLISNQIIS
jgi:hypothetical protein